MAPKKPTPQHEEQTPAPINPDALFEQMGQALGGVDIGALVSQIQTMSIGGAPAAAAARVPAFSRANLDACLRQVGAELVANPSAVGADAVAAWNATIPATPAQAAWTDGLLRAVLAPRLSVMHHPLGGCIIIDHAAGACAAMAPGQLDGMISEFTRRLRAALTPAAPAPQQQRPSL